jgi:hypothetical protein
MEPVNWECLWRHQADPPRAETLFGSEFDIPGRQDDNGEDSFVSDFGENLLGIKSMTDLKDLIAAKDVEFRALHDAVSGTPLTSPPWPPNGYASWFKDYQALVSKWQSARGAAQVAIDAAGSFFLNPLGNLDSMSGQPFYDNIIKTLQPVPNTTSPGDLGDLHARLNAIKPIAAYTVPQPTQGADQQIAAYQALRPLDVLGDAKAEDNFMKYAVVGGAALVILLMTAAGVQKRV